MKKTKKMIAGMLAGAMMLSCVSAGAQRADNNAINNTEIQWSIEPAKWQPYSQIYTQYFCV